MTKTNNSPLYAGFIAGLATIVLVLLSQILLPPLFPFVIVPIFLIAFAYGTYSNITAGLTATVVIFIILSLISSSVPSESSFLIYGCLIYLFFYFLPASLFAWLYTAENKGNPIEDYSDKKQKDSHKYYSLAIIFNYMVLYFAVISTLTSIFLLNNAVIEQFISAYIEFFSEMLRSAEPGNPVIEQTIARLQSIEMSYFIMLTFSCTGIICLIMTFTGLYVGSRVATQKNWIARKRENWPLELRLPKSAVIVFVIVFILSSLKLNTLLTVVPFVFILILTVAFIISGLAFVHYQTRNLSYRIPLLVGIYICLFSYILTPFAIIGLTICGVIATFYATNRSTQTH